MRRKIFFGVLGLFLALGIFSVVGRAQATEAAPAGSNELIQLQSALSKLDVMLAQLSADLKSGQIEPGKLRGLRLTLSDATANLVNLDATLKDLALADAEPVTVAPESTSNQNQPLLAFLNPSFKSWLWAILPLLAILVAVILIRRRSRAVPEVIQA